MILPSATTASGFRVCGRETPGERMCCTVQLRTTSASAVLDVALVQRVGEQLLTELRIVPRAGDHPDIRHAPHLERAESLDELVQAAGQVAYGVDSRHRSTT